jgi:hypothetical protein
MRICRGNIFQSEKPFLVNPVNTVGVMGKGLALQFKRRYPGDMDAFYRTLCRSGRLQVGVPVIWRSPYSQNVMFFPTKRHWREPSQMSYIKQGLEYYITYLGDCDAAFPLLGAGLGGLDRESVLDVMESYLRDTDCEIWIL